MDRFGFVEGSFSQVSITPAVRSAVLQSWHGKCAYCERAAAEHVDHIIPSAKGGPDCLENYTAACAPCNLRKTDLILPDGMLAILLAKARRKTPKIESLLSARVAPVQGRETERRKLIAELRDLQRDEGEVLDMEEASITVLKREVSRTRRRVKARKKQQELSTAISELVDARTKVDPCPTVALLLTERARSRGELNTVSKVRSAISRAEKPRKVCGRSSQHVDLAMPQEVRRELQQLLSEIVLKIGEEIRMPFSRERAPHLFEHLKTCQRAPSAMIAGWRMNLMPSWSCRDADGAAEISIQAAIMWDALDRAEALGVASFGFKNTFWLDRIPPLSHCTPMSPSAMQ